MSKIAAGIAKINGIAAGVLQFIPGGQPFAALAMASATLFSTIAEITAKPPLSVPTLQDYTVGPNQPYPYLMGRCRSFGHMIHQEAHGRTRQDVPNPWLTRTYIYSGAGPVQGIEKIEANSNEIQFDGGTGWETGYFDKYMRGDTQLGETPESAALNTTAPDKDYWTGNSKLSGFCAAQFSMLLDDKEPHFRSGPPTFSLIVQGVKVYDPRLDSTYPGGTGAHRIDDESTFAYSQNPALHGLTYAYGRYQNAKHVCGGGMGVTSIDVASFVAAANTADLNGWTLGGVIYENGEDGEIWNNLKLILSACGAYPTNDGGVLRVIHHAPRVTLDTINEADLVGPCSTPGMKPWGTGFNTVVPRYMSEDNDWSYVQSDAIAVASLETAQGEARIRERKFDLVTNKDQAAALGVYSIYDSVELEPIQLTVGRRFINYGIGDAFDIDIPSLGLDLVAFIVTHSVDPETGNVTIGLKSDTTAKHAFALGQTGTAPPHPALVTNEDLDLAAGYTEVVQMRSQAIESSYTTGLTLTATDAGVDATINVTAHTRIYGNSLTFDDTAVNAGSVTGLLFDTNYFVYYDDEHLDGGGVTYQATTIADDAYPSETKPWRHYVGAIETPLDGGADIGGSAIRPYAFVLDDPDTGLIATRDAIVAGDLASSVLSVFVSPTSANGTTTGGAAGTTNSVAVQVAGGTSPYTYSVTKVSGDTFTVDSPTSSSTTFTVTPGAGNTLSAVYRYTVTDSAAPANNATVDFNVLLTDN